MDNIITTGKSTATRNLIKSVMAGIIWASILVFIVGLAFCLLSIVAFAILRFTK